MQCILRCMAEAVCYLGGIASRHFIMKQVFLIYMLTVSLSRAIEWENEYAVSAICDNTTMHLNVNFTNVFQGSVYQSKGYYNPKCSYIVPADKNVTEVGLSMPYTSCEIDIEELDGKTLASTEVVIQMHNLLDSIYDKTVKVSCEISNIQAADQPERGNSNRFEAQRLDHSWIEFKNGLVLFGEVGEPIESTLFLVVYVRDDGSNEDMVVQNCIAHTDRNLTNMTNLTRLSDFYGCPDPSAVLTNFTVVHSENDHVNMFAYASIANVSLITSGGRMSISCGITICKNTCPTHCNGTESQTLLPLSDYATKDIATRNDGVVMPDSLRDLNRHNDRSQRTPIREKRSLISLFTRIFQWESWIMNGSVSKENSTNVTSIGISKGLIVKNGFFAKDILVPAHKSAVGDAKKMDSNLVKDEYSLDGQTLRFICLMIICMFITVLACFCCYADEKKTTKGHSLYIL